MFTVLPLRAIATQILCLLVAIAVESWVLWRELGITPRQSIQYASTVNLLCTVLGWLVFFNVQPFLPEASRQEVFGFIFFNQWSAGIAIWMVLLGFLIFFASFGVKALGLDWLKLGLSTPQEWKTRQETITSQRPKLGQRPVKERRPSTQANAVLVANALSYTAITVLLVIQFLFLPTVSGIAPAQL